MEITKNEDIKITTLDELKKYNEGAIVELPPFAEGQPFYVRLKRPSMLSLVKSGKIPNELLIAANSLFSRGSSSFDSKNSKAMQELLDVIDVVCEVSFLEPTYQQIKESGVQLTDEQMMFVFGYAQNGVRQLTSFRK